MNALFSCPHHEVPTEQLWNKSTVCAKITSRWSADSIGPITPGVRVSSLCVLKEIQDVSLFAPWVYGEVACLQGTEDAVDVAEKFLMVVVDTVACRQLRFMPRKEEFFQAQQEAAGCLR